MNFGVSCTSSSKLPLCLEARESKVTNPIVICPPINSKALTVNGTVCINPSYPSFAGKLLTVNGDVNITGVIDPTAVGFSESTSSPIATEDGRGVLWVRNDTPNTLIFTDDGGTDHDLLATSGDVSGPAIATDNAIARFDGITGDQIDDSILILDDAGDINRGSVSYLHQRGGTDNFGAGKTALHLITGGQDDNTAVGQKALAISTSGSRNTVVGALCMGNATSGSLNTAVGHAALISCASGERNTAIGEESFMSLLTGSDNIALGHLAGSALTFGDSDNICIGSTGAAGDNGRIRIGSGSQTTCFVEAIRGVTTGVADAVPVLIDSVGQIGTMSSSIRFKQDVEQLDDELVEKLRHLIPVSFRYKNDPSHPQFGLIAEDVMDVIPDLVSFDKEGKIESVKYHLLHAFYIKALQQCFKRLEECEKKMY